MAVPQRICTAMLLLVMTSVPAYAQMNVGGGVKGGVNVATVSGDIDEDVSKSNRFGGAFGGFLSLELGESIAFEPEVLYSMQGVTLKFSEGGEAFESAVKLNMVEIPLLVRFGMQPRGRTAGYFLAGPSVGFVASAKQEDPFGGSDEDIKDILKSTSVGVVVGAGVTVSQFLAEARYAFGLTDLNDEDTGDANKSRVFSVLVGVRF